MDFRVPENITGLMVEDRAKRNTARKGFYSYDGVRNTYILQGKI